MGTCHKWSEKRKGEEERESKRKQDSDWWREDEVETNNEPRSVFHSASSFNVGILKS